MGLENSVSSYYLDEYQRCPRLWDLSRRWVGPRHEPGTEPFFNHFTAIGTAVAEGLKVARLGKSDDLVEAAARSSLAARYRPNKEWTLNGLMTHVRRGIELGRNSNLGCELITVEKKYGHCIPDWVGRDETGALKVGDDKTSFRLEQKYRQSKIDDYLWGNQLWQGAAEVAAYLGEPVKSIAVNLIVLSPEADAECISIDVLPEIMEYWLNGVSDDWMDMKLIKSGQLVPTPRFSACRDRFGSRCKFWSLCHNLGGDESRAEALYERRTYASHPGD